MRIFLFKIHIQYYPYKNIIKILTFDETDSSKLQ